MVHRANVCVVRDIDTGCVLGNDVVDIDLSSPRAPRAFRGHGLVEVLGVPPRYTRRCRMFFARFCPLRNCCSACVKAHGFETRGRLRNASSSRVSLFLIRASNCTPLVCAYRVASLTYLRLRVSRRGSLHGTLRVSIASRFSSVSLQAFCCTRHMTSEAIFLRLIFVMFPDDPTLRTFFYLFSE